MDSGQTVLKEKLMRGVIFTGSVTDYKLKQTSFHWIKLANTNDDKKYGHLSSTGLLKL
jgi:hypothetical protein